MRLHVVTAAKSAGIGGGLTYESADIVGAGTLVHVPLRNKLTEGIVIGQSEDIGDFDLKSISQALHKKPLLTHAHIRTAQWMAEHYCCSLRQAIRVFLPSPPWNALLPSTIEGYCLLRDEAVRGKMQQRVIELLRSRGFVPWETLRTEGVTKVTVRSLMKQGIIVQELRQEEDSHNPLPSLHRPNLSIDQRAAATSLCKENRTSLLFGITGSGKTEVYAELIADVIEGGRQAILLVPEILLTETTIRRFIKLIDEQHIAVLHSRLTPSQRRAQWKRIRYGDVKLVIGSRSALFAPVTNLGLVIIDEEHEWTYKNEQTPRYHARETAEQLCKQFGAKLVLGSATPSLETWYRVQQGIYALAELPQRYGSSTLPVVKVIDLAQVQFGSNYPFSNTLFDAIEDRIARKEQSVLFLNRRGIATSLICLECRRRVVSPESGLPFTVHRNNQKSYLQDHTTGTTADVPSVCSGCGNSNLRAVGAGTHGVEDILKRRFPAARLLRADSDTLTHPDEMRDLLTTMLDNKADILIGTQSVVKGLDLPNVTLAAVLIADVGMSLPHFRAGERTFQLLTQLTGRSGRSKPGEVIVQTFRPEAIEVKFAAFHKTRDYLDQELKMREAAGYPPVTSMIRLILRGPDVKRRAQILTATILQNSSNHAISCAPTLFGGGKEWHIFIRGNDPRSVIKGMDVSDAVIDVDPLDCV